MLFTEAPHVVTRMEYCPSARQMRVMQKKHAAFVKDINIIGKCEIISMVELPEKGSSDCLFIYISLLLSIFMYIFSSVFVSVCV